MDGDCACCLAAAGRERAGLSGGVGLNEYGEINVGITQYTGGLAADGAFFQGPERVGQAIDAKGMGAVCPVVERKVADAGSLSVDHHAAKRSATLDMNYTEDTLVQQTTAEYMESVLGWESVYPESLDSCQGSFGSGTSPCANNASNISSNDDINRAL
jgi:hypothetical protein